MEHLPLELKQTIVTMVAIEAGRPFILCKAWKEDCFDNAGSMASLLVAVDKAKGTNRAMEKVLSSCPFNGGHSEEVLKHLLKILGSSAEDLGEALLLSIQANNYPLMGELLDAGAKADTQDHQALMYAAENRDSDLAYGLLIHPVNAARADARDCEALFIAVDAGSEECVEVLLATGKHPARANARDGKALHDAVELGYLRIARALLQDPVHPPAPNAGQSKSLAVAAQNGDLEMMRLLMSAPHNPARADHDDSDALVVAVDSNIRVDGIKLLLRAPHHAAHADAHDNYPICCAARHGNTEAMRLLLDAPAHPATPTAEALEAAMLMHRAPAARLLMERRKFTDLELTNVMAAVRRRSRLVTTYHHTLSIYV